MKLKTSLVCLRYLHRCSSPPQKKKITKNVSQSQGYLRRCSSQPQKKKIIKKSSQTLLSCGFLPSFLVVALQTLSSQKKKHLKKKTKKQLKKEEPEKLFRTTNITHKTVTETATVITTAVDGDADHDKDVSIYLKVIDEYDIFNWYKIDPNKIIKTYPVYLQPITSPMPSSTPRNFGSVITPDSKKLYALGGSYMGKSDPTTEAVVCDLNTDETPSWKELPPLLAPRKNPAVAAIDGKIYAVNCFNTCPSVYAEVFDPCSNSWSALPPPPCKERPTYTDTFEGWDFDAFLRLHPPPKEGENDDGNIMFSTSKGDIYRVNEKTNSWTCAPLSVDLLYGEPVYSVYTNSVFVDDVIYTYTSGSLYACDLTKPRLFLEEVYGLGSKLNPKYTRERYLAYIGKGKMCLVWDTGFSWKEKMFHINCLRFWVGRRDPGNGIRAVVDRLEEYVVPGQQLCGFLAA